MNTIDETEAVKLPPELAQSLEFQTLFALVADRLAPDTSRRSILASICALSFAAGELAGAKEALARVGAIRKRA